MGHKTLKKKYPWRYVLYWIRTRCYNPNTTYYKFYGGKGIKCLISENDIKKLWFRDKAYSLKKPSIDRIDKDGNYEFSNCRFIELSKNTIYRNKNNGKKVYQLTENKQLIKIWNSMKEVAEFLNVPMSSLSKYLRKGDYFNRGFWSYGN